MYKAHGKNIIYTYKAIRRLLFCEIFIIIFFKETLLELEYRSTGSQAIKNQSCELDTYRTLHTHSHLILNVLCKMRVLS